MHKHLNLMVFEFDAQSSGGPTLRLIQDFFEVKFFYNPAQKFCDFLPIVSTKVPGG